jgi:cobalt-zinc-cadmium efflux system protein
MVVEFIGGFITNSLALISDSGHMLSDSVALGIALAAVFIGQKQITKNNTYGYQRFEILAAALNGITLVGIALYIFIEAILRFQQPQHIEVQGMLIVASIGLLINIIVAVMIFKGSDTEHDLNMRGAYLHVLSDLLGSIGAIAAALCIYFLMGLGRYFSQCSSCNTCSSQWIFSCSKGFACFNAGYTRKI